MASGAKVTKPSSASSLACRAIRVQPAVSAPFAGVAGGCHRLLTLPIEMAFAKLNSHLRHIGARTIDALLNAIGEICGFFDPRECWNYFRAAGYVSD